MDDLVRKPSDCIKLYDEVRSAHLERLNSSPRRLELLFRKEYYDYDRSLAGSNVTKVSRFNAIRRIMDPGVRAVELNEPLFVRALPSIIAYLMANTARRILGRPRFAVLTYAIENLDFAEKLSYHTHIPARILKGPVRLLMGFVIRRYSKIAFGTEAAFANYSKQVGRLPSTIETKLISAIEPICSVCKSFDKSPAVVFVSAFEQRKGISELLAAWDDVSRQRPDAKLYLIGKGELHGEVLEWSQNRSSVITLFDPPRLRIHEILAAATVLVLPSIESATWKEQIGLPILEGLSHGCTIVATSSTGLAPWLQKNGHIVIEDATKVEALTEALSRALSKPVSEMSVFKELPKASGRTEAEEWLWRE